MRRDRDAGHPSVAAARERLEHGGRVLVTRLRFTGDVIMSLPLARALAEAYPRAEVHYLAEAAAHAALWHHPSIGVRWLAPRTTGATVQLVRALRAQRFAVAIDLFCNARSAVLVGTSGSPVRVGEARRVRRRIYTCARVLVPGRSAIEQHLDALRALGIEPPPASRPELHLDPVEREAGRRAWAAPEAVLLHLTATQPAKEWPVEHAVALVRALRRDGLDVVLGSVPGREQPSSEVAERTGARLLPPMPLRRYFAVIAAANAVVAVDGAVVHAAVALGRPTVALFGPTDPQVWFPYAAFGPFRVLRAGVDCGGCDRDLCPERRCMRAIEPQSVALALHEVCAAARPEVHGA